MKKVFYLSFLLISCLTDTSYAQFGVTKAEFSSDVVNRKLIVVLSQDDNIFNESIKKVIEAEWRLSDFEFINQNDIKKYISPNNVFISYQEFTYSTQNTSVPIKSAIKTSGIKLFIAKNKKGKIIYSSIITVKLSPSGYSFPGISKNAEERFNEALDSYTDNDAKIIEAVNMIQNHINYFKDKGLSKNLDEKELLKLVSSENKVLIKDKTLLFTSSTLHRRISNKDEIKKIYDHPFKFVTVEEVENAIKNKTTNTAYFKIVSVRSLTFILVIDCKTSRILYGEVGKGFNQMQIPPRVFEELN